MKEIYKILNWIRSQKKKNKILVSKKSISNLVNWKLNKKKIFHKSGKFFQIISIRAVSNFYKKKWDQPLIVQNEKGILGILMKKYNGRTKYLLQAKIEPGNINKLQLSPTVQATKSNYSRVHGGKKIKYLKYFLKKNNNTLIKSKQYEQGFRYLFKQNINMIVRIKKNIKLDNNYRWVSKKDLIQLSKKKNILNMDTISVFSCSINKNVFDIPLNSSKEIKKWYNSLKIKYYIRIIKIPLLEMKNWNFNNQYIFNEKKKYFNIIGIKVKTNSREVKEWEQPIIQGKKLAFAGFIIKKINLTVHYLVRFNIKPGLKIPGISCTVNTSDIEIYKKNADLTFKSKDILTNFFINKKKGYVVYNNILSDEGGRFFHNQIRNMVVEIGDKDFINFDKKYIWVSHNQMIGFIKQGTVDIETRLLFTSLNFDKIL